MGLGLELGLGLRLRLGLGLVLGLGWRGEGYRQSFDRVQTRVGVRSDWPPSGLKEV